MAQNTLIAIDSDVGFLGRFQRILDDLPVLSEFNYASVHALGSTESQIIEYCVEEVTKIAAKTGLEAIFVDIVLLEREEASHDRSGLIVAQQLRELYPDIPVVGITRFIKPSPLISQASFSPHLQGILIKPYVESADFARRDFLTYLQQARQKLSAPPRSVVTKNSISRSTLHIETLKKRFQIHEDPRCRYQIEEVGVKDLFNLLDALFPSGHGTISYLRPGFSGSYLFKVFIKTADGDRSPSMARCWAVKVSDHMDKLSEELDRSRRLSARLPQTLYPSLLQDEVVQVGRWGAIAFELQDNTDLFFDVLGRRQNEKTIEKLVHSSLVPFLSAHYGNPVNQHCYVWKTFYSLDERCKAGALTFLDDARQLMRRDSYITTGQIKRLQNFIISDGQSEQALSERHTDVDTRYIHGDLHSRNILVTKEQKPRLVFIDFANSAQDHYLKDIAKLETDILFHVMDSRLFNDTEWDRLKEWSSLLQLCEVGKIFRVRLSQSQMDSEVRFTARVIKSLREALRELGPAPDERDYCSALLYYSVKVLGYVDVSRQKKMFALRYILQLLDSSAKVDR